jgi:hypothetical protein
MAILATIFGALGRFAGRVLTTTLGWAATLLFGQVRRDRQVVLAAVTFGSVVWVVLLIGVVVPEVGTMLLAFVPVPDFVDELWVRLAMLAGAVILPLVVGAALYLLLDKEDRPRGSAIVGTLLRGYPLTAALAFVLVFLAVIGTVRKARVLFKRWSDAHIPIVVRPGGYSRVVGDLETALDQAGLAVTRRDAPRVLAAPGRLLASVAGPSVRRLVPERLQLLTANGLEVLIHQSDIAISGGSAEVARARAAIASRLASTAASRTTTEQAQAIERRLEALTRGEGDPATELGRIDEELARIEVDADEWEVLYRIRLQVERDLLAGRRPGDSFPGDGRGPATEPPAPGMSRSGLGAAAMVAALLAVDLVLVLRDRGLGRS